ncbi:MAG: acetyl-CoA carboxylase biotin carboxylase subunit [Bdellovibrionota bacterium]
MKKILIANRGEIAVRVIRACQEMGIKTVAIHSTADKDSLHAKLADESICIGPGASVKSYLHIPSVMSAAELAGVDGIHPGYGFLSENSEFAEVCEQYKIKFIGPKPRHIEALGNKVQARALAIKAKVPLLPGSDGAIDCEDTAIDIAEKIGYPVIIKASAGGGGRGMKIVRDSAELLPQLRLCQSEAQAAFGNPECFIEKYLEKPRHVEFQLAADEHGHVVHLGERDCSIQRRHQKLVEESPCPVLSAELRSSIGKRAVGLLKEVGYCSLATVEFLYENNQFYFMEVNTRVQVEHPVSEMVTGEDLIKLQIKIAMGEHLPFAQESVRIVGHSMECRINAEDPSTFAPWPGQITAYHEPGGPGIRVDSMVYAGYTVPSIYDSMLAKLIAYGRDREECLVRMRRALKEMKVEGIRTNIPFHIKLLDSKAFQSGDISTKFLEEFLTPKSH